MKGRMAPGQVRRTTSAIRSAVPLAGIILAMVAVTFSILPPAALGRTPKTVVGTSAGNFTLQDIAGKKISLSDFRGKTVLLSFWATWCLPCKVELPTLEKIYEQHQDKDVVVLAVDDESEAMISKFMNDHHYSFTALLDSKRTLFQRFNIQFIPTVIVINNEGIVVRKIVGWHGPQDLLGALNTGQWI